MRRLLKAQASEIGTFVEPFAGGASVALQLAAEGTVRRIILADVDDLIASFWTTAAFDTTWLIDAMWDLEVSVSEWERFRASTPSSTRDKALKCLFLNRTSYSGILHHRAGPIGGKRQTGPNLINCRFSKETLHNRIAKVGLLAQTGSLTAVWNTDWKDTVARATTSCSSSIGTLLFYCDPPFYAKAQDLYRYAFTHADHATLASALRTLESSWLLSYDDHAEVRKLYLDHANNGSQLIMFAAEYRASAASRRATELLVTNLPVTVIPEGLP